MNVARIRRAFNIIIDELNPYTYKEQNDINIADIADDVKILYKKFNRFVDNDGNEDN